MIDSRAKGNRAEVEVVKLINAATGHHVSRSRTPGFAADIGDVVGLPNTTIEVKARKSMADAVNEGIPQAAAAAERSGMAWPTVWVRRPGGRYVVVMTPDTFFSLHREATS